MWRVLGPHFLKSWARMNLSSIVAGWTNDKKGPTRALKEELLSSLKEGLLLKLGKI